MAITLDLYLSPSCPEHDDEPCRLELLLRDDRPTVLEIHRCEYSYADQSGPRVIKVGGKQTLAPLPDPIVTEVVTWAYLFTFTNPTTGLLTSNGLLAGVQKYAGNYQDRNFNRCPPLLQSTSSLTHAHRTKAQTALYAITAALSHDASNPKTKTLLDAVKHLSV